MLETSARPALLIAAALLAGTCAFAGAARAQQAADSPVYTVTYIETAPASARNAVALLKQYRDDSRTDEGCARLDLLAQTGRQGHFLLIEAWRDQRTADRHDASAHTKEFVDRLKPLLTSPVDTRPYKNLSVGISSRAVPSAAAYVVSHVDMAPAPGTDGPGVMTRLAEASRKENDNLRFDVLQHSVRGNHFTVIEIWASDRAADAHALAAHTKKYREDLQPLAGSPLDERTYRAVN